MIAWPKATDVESVAKTLAILIGGGWAFWRYVYQAEFKRRIGFTVEVVFVAMVRDHWLVELVAVVDNKGLVTHRITDFTFGLRCIYDTDEVVDADERANGQTSIPHILKKGSWLPAAWKNTFIRPGVCTRYKYVTAVPKQAVSVLLTGRFNYPGKDSFHTATQLIKVPNSDADAITTSR